MIDLIFSVAILGVLAWLVLQLPMPQLFRNLIVGIMVIAAVLWLQSLGVALPFSLRLK